MQRLVVAGRNSQEVWKVTVIDDTFLAVVKPPGPHPGRTRPTTVCLRVLRIVVRADAV
jgi:hypothetical protein